ncbi:MAG: threonine--tRNA ligase [Candidatus Paceibacterota bacterium]|jgi:threonyl-tRNA synthetase
MIKNEKLESLRHSAEHVLTMAMLRIYPDLKAAMGPATADGFYFDFDSAQKISEEDFPKIEKEMEKIIKGNLPIIKDEMTIKDAKEFFSKNIYKNNEYKHEWLDAIKSRGEQVSVYWMGEKGKDIPETFVDICAGPHVKSTSEIKAFKLMKVAGAYWHGDEKNKMLTRIYGTAFENKKDLEDYLKLLEEAEKRDHKKLGKELGLLMFHETAPGMPYWLPKGLILYKELENYWRKKHTELGYLEIASPLVNKAELWKISGHWEHYKDDMFIADMGENEIYGIKPMNCPNAMIVFKSMQVSYKDLPLRLSDTDRLHRYERSGVLNGLLRCRSFQQDDSHNYITEEMIEEEYKQIMEICKEFYGIFNLEYKFRLGTRPEGFLGDIETWNKAEKALYGVLEKSGKEYSVAEGDGAFYGPKIDIVMKDALGRDWQMGTMQLDFQQPRRFDLTYMDRDGKKRTPVVIHRVIYGSLERFIGILIEHYAGAFPLWLSPVQVKVIPVRTNHNEYAKKVFELLKENNIRVELDDAEANLGGKVRDAKNNKIPYWVVIGDKEIEANKITLESRDKGQLGQISKEELLEKLTKEIKEKTN